MKGLVLAAGKGSRLAELNLKHKGFAMINHKHVIDYSLDLLWEQRSKLNGIVIVVGYHAQDIIDYVGDNYKGVPVNYVHQTECKGIADAIRVASSTINDDYILCLADEVLINPRLGGMIDCFVEQKLDCVCGTIIDVNDFSMKPIAYTIGGDNRILSVTEKPSEYVNEYRGIGECIFKKETLRFLDSLKPNSIRGEFEMGDYIRTIIENGGNCKVFNIADAYANINYAKDIKMAEELQNGTK